MKNIKVVSSLQIGDCHLLSNVLRLLILSMTRIITLASWKFVFLRRTTQYHQLSSVIQIRKLCVNAHQASQTVSHTTIRHKCRITIYNDVADAYVDADLAVYIRHVVYVTYVIVFACQF